MTAYERLQDEVAYGWRKLHGRCGVYINRPVSPIGCIVKVLKLYLEYNPDRTALVVANSATSANEIRNIIKSVIPQHNIEVTYEKYIKDFSNLEYSLCITICVENNTKLNTIINNIYIKHFLCIFDNRIIGSKDAKERERMMSFAWLTIQPSQILEECIHLPVEDNLIPVALESNNLKDYNDADKFISESMRIFGCFETLDRCRQGDRVMGYSAIHVCNIVASNNGWNEELDTSTPFGEEVDKVYNPNALKSRADLAYSIMKKRKDIVTDAEEKLPYIADIVMNNTDAKILIVSARGDFASKITDYLNNIVPDGEDKFITICADYHDNIPDRIQTNPDGSPVLVKTGAKAGQPKVIGSKKQSTLAEKDYNNDVINILSIKAASDANLTVDCDIVILTSPFAGHIYDVRRRFQKVLFRTNPLKVYTLYCNGTTENTKVDKLIESPIYRINKEDEELFTD